MTMKAYIPIYYFCAFCVLLASCNRKAATVATNEARPNSTEVPMSKPESPKEEDKNAYIQMSIEKTACFGKCPVYKARVMSNGKAYFQGTMNVDMIGNYEAQATAEQLKTLMENVHKINYFNLENRYPKDENHIIADLPYTYTYVSDGKQEKKIANNYDCPSDLTWFESELQTFFIQLDWKQVK